METIALAALSTPVLVIGGIVLALFIMVALAMVKTSRRSSKPPQSLNLGRR